jgi:hypothetical protein
LPCCSHSVFG